jgi:hypothetical protein
MSFLHWLNRVQDILRCRFQAVLLVFPYVDNLFKT